MRMSNNERRLEMRLVRGIREARKRFGGIITQLDTRLSQFKNSNNSMELWNDVETLWKKLLYQIMEDRGTSEFSLKLLTQRHQKSKGHKSMRCICYTAPSESDQE